MDWPAASQEIEARLHRRAEVGRLDAIDAHHLRAHVGQQHAAERARPDARELDDLNSFQRSH